MDDNDELSMLFEVLFFMGLCALLHELLVLIHCSGYSL